MIRLALLRHGPTEWNREGRIQGRTDIPLDDAAKADLEASRLPHPWRNARLVSSPLQRACATAKAVSGQAPRLVEALREMDWGDWEGQKGADLRANPESGFRDIEHWGAEFCPPGGEPLASLRVRVLGWANALSEDTLAVCHIGVMRVLLAEATDWRFSGPCPFRIKRNRLYVLQQLKTGWRLEADTPRLERGVSCA